MAEVGSEERERKLYRFALVQILIRVTVARSCSGEETYKDDGHDREEHHSAALFGARPCFEQTRRFRLEIQQAKELYLLVRTPRVGSIQRQHTMLRTFSASLIMAAISARRDSSFSSVEIKCSLAMPLMPFARVVVLSISNRLSA